MNHFQYASGIAISRAAHRSIHEKVFPSPACISKDLTNIKDVWLYTSPGERRKVQIHFPILVKGHCPGYLHRGWLSKRSIWEKQWIYSSQRKVFVDSTSHARHRGSKWGCDIETRSLLGGVYLLAGGISGKESACQRRRLKRHGFDPWVWKILLSRKWLPTQVFLPGKSHRQRRLAGYSP